jgi:hypothetical protein
MLVREVPVRDVVRQRELVMRAYIGILALLLAAGFFSMVWSFVMIATA